jgi:phosphoglycerate dehydrogenase-like enzyme
LSEKTVFRVLCVSKNGETGPHVDILRTAGFELRHVPDGVDRFVEDNLISLLDGCVACIAGAEPYTAQIIAAHPQLRVIARSGVGFDAIDLDACDRAGVVVTTTPGVNHHAVAEHTIALLMGVARGFPGLDRRVRAGNWVRIPSPRVMGTTLGLVGLGRIGRAVATRAKGLGMKVLAHDPFPPLEFAEQWDVELTGFDDLLPRSDYVSLHLPMSAESRHLFGAKAFAKMKQGAVFVNTARGSLVDERALWEALKSGHLRGAGLDVFETEPLPLDSPLLALDNVILSPHVAGLDDESQHDTFALLARTIVDLRQGRWPADCVRNLKGVTGWKWDRA